ncbi:MAG: sigma-70 family RNA polymerase sigma factor [Alphaproteobacteria bacterium]|nr:sigma-70 family RNA polymerase sigma factor [Alphaproteobacteria bacterium]MCB9699566.1 sigma-70 family RNA polymerase sigma factor [Alphaproteobacteria bacterium]
MGTTADVDAARQGDRDAFARLVTAHASTVCAIATGILRNERAGEEVGQEVFVCAWQDLHRLEDPERFGPWIRQIARHRARNALRSRDRRREAPTDVATVPDPGPDPEQRLDADRREATLWKAVEDLDEDHREVLVLFYREGQRVEEVARRLELPEPTVRKRLSRARERLRGEVEERLGQRLTRSAPRAAVFVAAVSGALTPRSARAGAMTWVMGGALVAAALLLTAGAGTWADLRADLPPIEGRAVTVASLSSVPSPTAPALPHDARIVEAFLAAEDVRFFEHGAVDAKSTGRAALAMLTGGPRQGGSTITQQLAKGMLIEAQPEPSLRRKASEVVLAVELERTLDKDEILARYLDGVYLGAGATGVTEAAWTTFGVAPEDLTLAQAALLAGLAARPADHPFNDAEAARARRDEVLRRMEAAGLATPDEVAAARRE